LRLKNGTISKVEDNHLKKKTEKWSTEEAYRRNPAGVSDEVRAALRQQQQEHEQQQEQQRLAALAEQQRRQKAQQKEAHRAQLFRVNKPQNHPRKQVRFPAVTVGKGRDERAADNLVYRGMSVNNVRNLQRRRPVFTAQNPHGHASPEDHIVNDDPNSPYLSFEARGMNVSASKYAPKPIDPRTRKPRDVQLQEGGFLKQKKSYVQSSRERNPDALRMGYIGGIVPPGGGRTLDFSTPKKALALRSEEARERAVADAEVLVRPGPEGIAPEQVPFVAKTQEVDAAYYQKHVGNQTGSKALGYSKPFGDGADTTYYKIQIPPKYNSGNHQFRIPEELQRDDDEMSEMSSIASMNLSDYTQVTHADAGSDVANMSDFEGMSDFEDMPEQEDRSNDNAEEDDGEERKRQ
jgi:hypothetical protein